MQVGLGYIAVERETAFGEQTRPNPLSSDFDEPLLKIVKIHLMDPEYRLRYFCEK
jgi:hypothetical protein